MKIQKALEIGKDCGLKTVGEAILNIRIHATNIFSIYDMERELAELEDTWNWVREHRRTPDGKSRISEDTEIQLILDYSIADDMTDYEMYKHALANKSFAEKLGRE